MCNPRILGWVLYYAIRHALAKGKQILDKGHIDQGALEYYKRSINNNYFEKNGKIQAAYDEVLNLSTQKLIFDKLIAIAKKNQEILTIKAKEGRSKLLKQIYDIYKVIFNGHFRLEKGNVAEVLDSLLLNQYITIFSEGKSMDKNTPTYFYFFNYGLCFDEGLDFGIPTDKKIERVDKFLSQDRNFNYTEELKKNLDEFMEISCQTPNCPAKPIPISEKLVADYLDWKCRECGAPLVRKPQKSIAEKILKKHTEIADGIKNKYRNLLNDEQYEIMSVLSILNKECLAKEIETEINLSSRSIGLRMGKLRDFGYVEIIEVRPQKYKLTQNGYNFLND